MTEPAVPPFHPTPTQPAVASFLTAGGLVLAISGLYFDHDPEEAVRVRVRLLRELAATREPFFAAHLPFPSVGRVAVTGDVFRFVPADWEY
jgi:hypothetical protein